MGAAGSAPTSWGSLVTVPSSAMWPGASPATITARRIPLAPARVGQVRSAGDGGQGRVWRGKGSIGLMVEDSTFGIGEILDVGC